MHCCYIASAAVDIVTISSLQRSIIIIIVRYTIIMSDLRCMSEECVHKCVYMKCKSDGDTNAWYYASTAVLALG